MGCAQTREKTNPSQLQIQFYYNNTPLKNFLFTGDCLQAIKIGRILTK